MSQVWWENAGKEQIRHLTFVDYLWPLIFKANVPCMKLSVSQHKIPASPLPLIGIFLNTVFIILAHLCWFQFIIGKGVECFVAKKQIYEKNPDMFLLFFWCMLSKVHWVWRFSYLAQINDKHWYQFVTYNSTEKYHKLIWFRLC